MQNSCSKQNVVLAQHKNQTCEKLQATKTKHTNTQKQNLDYNTIFEKSQLKQAPTQEIISMLKTKVVLPQLILTKEKVCGYMPLQPHRVWQVLV